VGVLPKGCLWQSPLFGTNQESLTVCLLPEELDWVKILLATLIFYEEFPTQNKGIFF